MAITSTLPLLYEFTRTLRLGDGQYNVTVQVAGQALVEDDPEGNETSIMAVNPGGFWGLGSSFETAWPEFYANLKTILADLAAEAMSPAAFRKSVDELLAAAHDGLHRDWEAAAEARRKGKTSASHGLPVQEQYGPRGIQMVFVPVEEDALDDAPLRPKIAA